MTRSDRLALSSCLGAGFATLIDQSVVTYTVPSVAASLDATTGSVQWFLAVYSLTFGVGLVPAGRLGDAYGRRGVFVAGLALFLIGAAASIFAPSIGWAIAGRAIQGFGAGVISAQVLGIIQDLFTGRTRIVALSAYGVAASASAIVGPLAAGAVFALASPEVAWRLVLAINVPFILATAVLAALFAPRRAAASPRRPSLDVTGIALTGLAVLLATAPVIDPGTGTATTLLLLAGLAVTCTTLVWWERRFARRGGQPLFAPSLLRSRGFTGGSTIALLWFGAGVAQSAIITVYLLQTLRLPVAAAALLLIPGAAVRIVTSSLSSRFNDLLGRWTLPLFLGIQFAAAAALVLLSGAVQAAPYLVCVVALEAVIGAASGATEPTMRALTLSYARPGEYGLAASFLQLAQRLSATFCVALVTGVAFASGAQAVSAEGVRTGLVVCAALLLGAALIALRTMPAASAVALREEPSR